MRQCFVSVGFLLLVGACVAGQPVLNTLQSNIIKNTTPNKHHIGDYYGGGIIYYLSNTPDAPSGQQGLIAAITDANPERLMLITSGVIGSSTLPDLFTGGTNTIAMINTAKAAATTAPAAIAAHDFSTTEQCPTCTPWYLPSQEELGIMYQHKKIINAASQAHGGKVFVNYSYWSSTQLGSKYGWAVNFDDSALDAGGHSLSAPFMVRAVRAF